MLAPLILLLLTSCQSKKDICASWAGGVISYREAQEKLDVQSPVGYCQDYKDWTRNETLTTPTNSCTCLTWFFKPIAMNGFLGVY